MILKKIIDGIIAFWILENGVLVANSATRIGTVLQFLIFSIGLGQKMEN